MRIFVEWGRPLKLTRLKADSLVYTADLNKLPRKPGVYIFGRRFGRRFEALYVGRALRIRDRVMAQLNQVRLMQHLNDAKVGDRVVLAGLLRPLSGQRLPKALELTERALIRHFVSEAHDLVNKAGVRIWKHRIFSSRSGRLKRAIPAVAFLEKAKRLSNREDR